MPISFYDYVCNGGVGGGSGNGDGADSALAHDAPARASEERDLQKLTSHAVEWMLCHGALMRKPSQESRHAPFSLLPTPIPLDLFDHVTELAPKLNVLVDRISRDHTFLKKTLASVVETDDFTRQLVHILTTVEAEGIKQPIYLGLHRSDYMLHVEDSSGSGKPALPSRVLQVEFNTISASFGALSNRISALHRHLVSRFFPEGFTCEASVRTNSADRRFVDAMAAAARLADEQSPSVLFVVQPNERNTVDQRSLEFDLWERHKIPVFRRSLADIDAESFLDDDGALMLRISRDPERHRRISLVYYRAGYTPDDYPSQTQWDARLKVERSNAIKCPSIAYHLAGTKKVQQLLAQPKIVERFVDEDTAKSIRTVFAELRSLDEKEQSAEELDRTIARAIASPERWVLKPQREGGGHNFYGADVASALREKPRSELPAYILMGRIFPPTTRGFLVRDDEVREMDCASELGIYGAYIGDGSKDILNEACGHVLRTKPEKSDEGGVVSGFAVLDSPLLV